MSQARSPSPRSSARTIMWARRGCTPSSAMRLPWGVARLPASIASSWRSNPRAWAKAAAGGGVISVSAAGSAMPHAASSKRQRRQVGRLDLRRIEGRQRAFGWPRSTGDSTRRARVRPARPRRCAVAASDALTVTRRDMPLAGIEARAAPEAAIHHHAHAVDGERGFRDRSREDDLAPALRIAADRLVLLGQGQVAIERQDDGAILARQPFLGAADLRGAGQEGEDVAALFADRAADGGGHAILQPGVGIVAQMAGLDRKGAPFAAQALGARNALRHAFAVQGRRHDHEAQIVAQAGLRLQREGQRHVAFDGALMELVEQDRGDSRQRRIALQLAQEEAGRHGFDARLRPHLAVEAHAIADGLAHLLAQHRRHARRRPARRQPPRLQHDDLAALAQPASSSASGTRVVLPAPGGASSTRFGAAASAPRISGINGSIGRSVVRRALMARQVRGSAFAAPDRIPLPRLGEGSGWGKRARIVA